MKAIEVRYLCPTNTRGSRLKAFAEGGCQVIIGFPQELSGEAAYYQAARALQVKYCWPGEIVGGQLKNGNYVFCFKNQK
jgi:hypothetical protein